MRGISGVCRASELMPVCLKTSGIMDVSVKILQETVMKGNNQYQQTTGIETNKGVYYCSCGMRPMWSPTEPSPNLATEWTTGLSSKMSMSRRRTRTLRVHKEEEGTRTATDRQRK